MTTERKETIKTWLTWGVRGVIAFSVTIMADALKDMARETKEIKWKLALYEYQIKSLQSENALLKMDIKENNKEDAIQHNAIWQHLAQLKSSP